jgi:hypothetical protein
MARSIGPFDGKLNLNDLAGLDNTNIDEKQPEYNASECETVLAGRNNTRIILGRDRNLGIESGYGGRGHTRAGAIDIVVGMQGWNPTEGGEYDYEKADSAKQAGTLAGAWVPGKADKNFGSMSRPKPGDAARIYISQRCDIDEYFDIVPGDVGISVADSAIGMKADSIRIMSRKGIKLVTGKNPPGHNSLDGKLDMVYGIDLIAGNRDIKTGLLPGVEKLLTGEAKEIQLLQPIPKGLNLADCLKLMLERITRLNSTVSGIIMGLSLLGMPITVPRSGITSAGAAVTTLPDPLSLKTMTDFYVFMAKSMIDLSYARAAILPVLEIEYLNDMGANYINSRHNRTN